jgi:hypothetical protein
MVSVILGISDFWISWVQVLDFMGIYWWLAAIALVIGSWLGQLRGAALVERWTGRESRSEPGSGWPAQLYSLLYYGIAMGIGLPPIYLMPNADVLVTMSFLFAGITIGGMVAQAVCGRKNTA